MPATLPEVEALVDQLPAADKARLLEYLVPKVAAELRTESSLSSVHAAASKRFQELVEQIASLTPVRPESMVELVHSARR